ncbi:MAG TPA: hypothetical protein VFG43_16580 [Geminicoccaceae bacterium]|nr:hypothetical protein [Geminicoccaceae bacterium]
MTAGRVASWRRLARALAWSWRVLGLRLLALLGLRQPLLRTAGAAAPIAAKPDAPAPEPVAACERNQDPALRHPTLVALRRRAVEDLFVWLGCVAVPPQLWVILDRVVDPDEALRRLALSLGLEAADVQARRAEALTRFRLGVDLLIDLAAVGDRLAPEQHLEIEALLRGGDLERVEAAVGTLQAMLSARRSWEDLGGRRRLRAHEDLVDRLGRAMRRPLDLDPAEAARLLFEADRLHALTLALDMLAGRAERALQGLRSTWPWSWDATERPLVRDALARERQRLERLILESDGARLDPLFSTLEQVVQSLEALLLEAAGAAAGGPRDDVRPEAEPADPLAAARRFFRLAPDAPLDRQALDRARRRSRAAHHPDRFTRAADKAAHEAIFKEIDGHYEVLRRRLAA